MYENKKFNTIEIQKNIEEKRLILGINFENFLLKKCAKIADSFKKIFAAKNCAFFGSFAIILISILVRSTRDIGHDSATYLEIAQKMLNGGKYYEDFFEFNLPLSFWLTMIPNFFAKIFAINQIISAQIFSNLVGISAIYFSAKILERSQISKDRTIFNFLILSFACGYFLRVFTLQFNEFETKSSYFLAAAFLYFSFQFIEESKLKKLDQILIGSLSALIFTLKPNYGILVVVFEFYKLLKNKSFRQSFCVRNYTTLFLLIIYLLIIIRFFPQYFKMVSLAATSYYALSPNSIHIILREDIFPVFLIFCMCFFLLKKNNFLKQVFLLTLAAALISVSEMIGGYDQRFLFYSLSLPLLSCLTILLLRGNYIDFKKSAIFLFLIIFVLQFDQKNIFHIALNLCVFWWIFVIALSLNWKKVMLIEKSKLDIFFLPRDSISYLGFGLLTLASNALYFFPNTVFLAWISSAIIFILMINFYQNLHEKNSNSKKFSLLSTCVFFTVISYFISMHLAAIFNFETHYLAHKFKSPNFFNSEIIKNAKANAQADESVTIIAELIPETYPVMTYLGKKNNLPFLQMPLMFWEISQKEDVMTKKENYFLQRLKQQLQDPKNKLVFVKIINYFDQGQCRIGFLEYYLRDPEFRKIFLSNYVFLNRVIDTKISQKDVEFFYDQHNSKILSGHSKIIERDFEIYIRK